mgnify:CR=1 FL=1
MYLFHAFALGTSTTSSESSNYGSSKSNSNKFDSFGNTSKSSGGSISDIKTELYHINEIAELDRSKQIVFLKGYRSFICDKIIYYKDPRYIGRKSINYVEEKDQIKEDMGNNDEHIGL